MRTGPACCEKTQMQSAVQSAGGARLPCQASRPCPTCQAQPRRAMRAWRERQCRAYHTQMKLVGGGLTGGGKSEQSVPASHGVYTQASISWQRWPASDVVLMLMCGAARCAPAPVSPPAPASSKIRRQRPSWPQSAAYLTELGEDEVGS